MSLAIQFAMFSLMLSLLIVSVRLIKGPFVVDRLLSLDGIAVCLMGLLSCLTIYYKSALFIDVLLVFSLLNFLGTVAFVAYLTKRLKKYDANNHEDFE